MRRSGCPVGQPLRPITWRRSATQAETLDDRAVARDLGLLQVVQQTTALADEQQQATTAVVVVLVRLEVLGQVRDAVAEQRDLHLRRTGVALGRGVLGDDPLLGIRVGSDRHAGSFRLLRCAARRGLFTRALWIRGRWTACRPVRTTSKGYQRAAGRPKTGGPAQTTRTGWRTTASKKYPPSLYGAVSGWVRPAASVARASSSWAPYDGRLQTCSHCVQPRPRGRSAMRAGDQVVPPSVLTDTSVTGAAPLQERPVSRTLRPAGSSACQGSSHAERTGLTVSGSVSDGWSPPVIRYHLVFHGEVSSDRDTSREPSHLMLAMPTQPGSTSRSG